MMDNHIITMIQGTAAELRILAGEHDDEAREYDDLGGESKVYIHQAGYHRGMSSAYRVAANALERLTEQS